MRLFFVIVTAFCLTFGAWSQDATVGEQQPISIAEFDQLIDFHSTLPTIHAAIAQGQLESLQSRVALFSATVDRITVYENTEESFYAEVEVIDARWRDNEELDLYRAFLITEGTYFAPMIDPAGQGDDSSQFISRNSNVLVAGIILDVYQVAPDDDAPVIYAYDLKIIE